MDELFQVITVGLAVFLFSLFLLGIGSFAGGSWEPVAQGVAAFLLIVVGIYMAALTLLRLTKR